MSVQRFRRNITRKILTKNRYRFVLLPPRSFEWNKSHHTVLLLRFMSKNIQKLNCAPKWNQYRPNANVHELNEQKKRSNAVWKQSKMNRKKQCHLTMLKPAALHATINFFFYSIFYTKCLLSGKRKKKESKSVGQKWSVDEIS